MLTDATLADIQFRTSDNEPTRVRKLELLRRASVATKTTRTLYVSIEGMAGADPTKPLYRFRLAEDWMLGTAKGDAGVGAVAPTLFRLSKNGADNGGVLFTGSVGTDQIVSHAYPAGSLFELYPPLSADPNLDNVSLSIPVVVS